MQLFIGATYYINRSREVRALPDNRTNSKISFLATS